MRGDVHGDLAGRDVAALPRSDQLGHRLGGTTDHGGLRRCHHRHHHVFDSAHRQLREDLLGRQVHQRHRAGPGDAGHQPRPPADDAHAILQRQCAGDHRRGGLTHRMPDHRTRTDTASGHRRRQRDLHGEQGRLHPVDADHHIWSGHRPGHRKPGLGGDQRLDPGDGGGELRFGAQQFGTHLRPLRTLPGEHPDRAPLVATHRCLQRNVAVGDLAQRRRQLRSIPGGHRGAHRTVCPPTSQGVPQIRERHIVVGLHPISQPACAATQLPRRGGRERKQQRRFVGLYVGSAGVTGGCVGSAGVTGGCVGRRAGRCVGRRTGGGLFQDGVHIGTRHPVGGHGGPPGQRGVDRPRSCLLRHEQVGIDARHLRGQRGEMQIPGDHSVLQCQDRLDQPQHP